MVFIRHIGVDYSGAQTPTASLNGLRVYLAEGDVPPAEVLPPPHRPGNIGRDGAPPNGWWNGWPRTRPL